MAVASSCPICGGSMHEDAQLAAHGLMRCDGCGLRLAPERSHEELRALYGEAYFEGYAGGTYAEDPPRRRFEARRRLALLQRHVRAGRLLEVGCAAGFFLAEARDAGFDVIGVEPGEAMADYARSRFGLDVRTAYLADVELPPASLDAACAWHVLEHLPRPRAELERVRTMLRPGGLLALEVPNAASRQAQRLGDAWPHWDHAHHLAHHTPASMRRLLEGAGFEVVELHTFPGTGYIPTARALRPVQAANLLKEALALRALPRRPHRDRHELIRAVALRAS